MYRALSLFPEKLEEKPLSPSEFTSHFKDFYCRPVQDIVEALRRYCQQGYFNFELTLAPEYLNHGQALAGLSLASLKLFPKRVGLLSFLELLYGFIAINFLEVLIQITIYAFQ